MLSASTARLVEGAATLGESELVQIKGGDRPVPAHRLVRIEPRHGVVGRVESSLVGRRWEMAAIEANLDRSMDGHGGVGIIDFFHNDYPSRATDYMSATARRNRTGMGKSRTLVLVATMRSPNIGSPDQT